MIAMEVVAATVIPDSSANFAVLRAPSAARLYAAISAKSIMEIFG
jgi:hypothetical protein